MSSSKNTNLNLDNLESLKLVEFAEKHQNTDILLHNFTRIWIPIANLAEMATKLKNLGYVTHVLTGVMHFKKDDSFGRFSVSSTGLDEGKMYYTPDCNLDDVISVIEDVADNSRKLEIRWITDADGNYYNLVEIMDDKVTDSLYPYITQGVDNYIDEFMASKSSIIILLGPPGTGKTGFIRHLLSRMDKKAYVTYNNQVFEGDDAFADFVSSSSSGAFVIEDADLLLMSRESGNDLMSKFLNIGDGVIKMNGKKLIFSTNLPSTKDIDDAILRAGRCFGVLEFRPLTLTEAKAACKDFDLPDLEEDREYKLTEIFNRGKIKARKKMGFC
jgi:hypothetical protein